MTIIIIIIALGIASALFIAHQERLKLRARLMREAVRNRDFTFRLPVKGLFYGERALQEALNDLCQDVNKLVAQNEVESWQKLVRVLTHEIMNATTPICSISQAYMNHPKVVGTPIEKGIHAINEASNSLVCFVESYRKMTQLQEPVISRLSLSDLMMSVKALYQDVAWHTDMGRETSVMTDATLVRQVVVNIVKNAIEADAKTIGVSLDGTTLRISNDGRQIPAEVRRDIFIPFYTTKATGTGIGLALSRQIMTTLGGSLTLADKADSGYHATFILNF
ncbi:MAG: sensor histidine kinase [Prevotella sp.]